MDIQTIPAQPQRQDSVAAQLSDLVAVANRLGMYDAADAVKQMAGKLPKLRCGCHCDLEPNMKPDGCLVDDRCIYAKTGIRSLNCDDKGLTTFTMTAYPPCKHTKGFFTSIPHWWWRKRVFACEQCGTIRTEDKEYMI